MKTTGFVRKVDMLGRIVLPAELRRALGIEADDSLEIYVDDQNIVMRVYKPTCFLCGAGDDFVEYRGKIVCRDCIEKMKEE